MAGQPLIRYQLALQSDPDELARFRAGGQAAIDSMRRHGVPSELHEALLAGDHQTIAAALHREVVAGAVAPVNLTSDQTWIMTQFISPDPKTDR